MIGAQLFQVQSKCPDPREEGGEGKGRRREGKGREGEEEKGTISHALITVFCVLECVKGGRGGRGGEGEGPKEEHLPSAQ